MREAKRGGNESRESGASTAVLVASQRGRCSVQTQPAGVVSDAGGEDERKELTRRCRMKAR